jgi:hypothetical protein
MVRPSIVVYLFFQVVAATVVFGGSETPPPGPPWKRDFYEAQREALQSGRPLFLYFTKTY